MEIRPIDKDKVELLQEQTEEYLENIEVILTDWLNVVGKFRVEKYVERTIEMEERIYDLINPGLIETQVLNNPNRAWAFIKEYPPHLKQYIKNQYTKGLNLMTVRKRWQLLMMIVAKELRGKNCPSFTDETVIIYNFHFSRKHTSPDNMTISFLNNGLRDTNLIKADDFERLNTIICGCLDPQNPGMEMTLVSKSDFIKHVGVFFE